MLRHITDLFLVGSDQYSEEEIELIDDVFLRLVATIEQSSRALLSLRTGARTGRPDQRYCACSPATMPSRSQHRFSRKPRDSISRR